MRSSPATAPDFVERLSVATLIQKDLETAAFNVFLYGRMIGDAAEIDDPSTAGGTWIRVAPGTVCVCHIMLASNLRPQKARFSGWSIQVLPPAVLLSVGSELVEFVRPSITAVEQISLWLLLEGVVCPGTTCDPRSSPRVGAFGESPDWAALSTISASRHTSFSFLISSISRRTLGLGHRVSHFGLGVTLLGIVAATAWGSERIAEMKVGDNLEIAHYRLTFSGLFSRQGPNYRDTVGRFIVRRMNGDLIGVLPKPDISRGNVAPFCGCCAAMFFRLRSFARAEPKFQGGFG